MSHTAERSTPRGVTVAQLWLAAAVLVVTLLIPVIALSAHFGRLETTVERHVEQPSHYRTAETLSTMLERLARIESKLDELKERVDREGRR